MSETERTMLDRLNVRYGKTYKNGSYVGREFARAEHVPNGVGLTEAGRRIADFMAVRMFSSHGYEHLPYFEQRQLADEGVISWQERTPTLIGHEVKISRADWLTELRDPTKSEAWKQFCHGWYLVAADSSVARPDELPDGWGLMVSHGRSLKVVVRTPRLDPVALDMNHTAALTRAVMQTETRLTIAAFTPTATEGN